MQSSVLADWPDWVLPTSSDCAQKSARRIIENANITYPMSQGCAACVSRGRVCYVWKGNPRCASCVTSHIASAKCGAASLPLPRSDSVHNAGDHLGHNSQTRRSGKVQTQAFAPRSELLPFGPWEDVPRSCHDLSPPVSNDHMRQSNAEVAYSASDSPLSEDSASPSQGSSATNMARYPGWAQGGHSNKIGARRIIDNADEILDYGGCPECVRLDNTCHRWKGRKGCAACTASGKSSELCRTGRKSRDRQKRRRESNAEYHLRVQCIDFMLTT